MTLETRVQRGDREAVVEFGILLFSSDEPRAVKLLESAAQQGSRKAHLALFFHFVPIDSKRAAVHLSAAKTLSERDRTDILKLLVESGKISAAVFEGKDVFGCLKLNWTGKQFDSTKWDYDDKDVNYKKGSFGDCHKRDCAHEIVKAQNRVADETAKRVCLLHRVEVNRFSH
jgi:hypothetical protein